MFTSLYFTKILPLLTPFVSRRTEHSSIAPNGSNKILMSGSDIFFDNIPMNSFLSVIKKHLKLFYCRTYQNSAMKIKRNNNYNKCISILNIRMHVSYYIHLLPDSEALQRKVMFFECMPVNVYLIIYFEFWVERGIHKF